MQSVRCQGTVRLRAAAERTSIAGNRTKCAAMARLRFRASASASGPPPACKGVKIVDERSPSLRGVDSPMFSASLQQVALRALPEPCFSFMYVHILICSWPGYVASRELVRRDP